MLFEVFAKDGTGRMETTNVNVIPWEQLDSMQKAGFKFKLDGKRVTIKELKTKLSSSHASTNPRTVACVIRCLENDKVYNKQSEAAKDLNIDPAQVSDSIKTGRKRSGYTFVKEEIR